MKDNKEQITQEKAEQDALKDTTAEETQDTVVDDDDADLFACIKDWVPSSTDEKIPRTSLCVVRLSKKVAERRPFSYIIDMGDALC